MEGRVGRGQPQMTTKYTILYRLHERVGMDRGVIDSRNGVHETRTAAFFAISQIRTL